MSDETAQRVDAADVTSQSTQLSKSGDALVYPRVALGDASILEPYVLLGVPPVGHIAGELELLIGNEAHVRSHSVIYAGTVIGLRFNTGHGVLVREFNEIGDNVSIGSHSVIEHHIRIGNGVRIHSNAFIPEFSVLEDGSWIGPNVVLTNALYPLGRGAKDKLRGPVVQEGAKIGANATLLPGLVIGSRALVGAGSVVVDDVPAGQVVAGNPARIIRSVDDIADYRPAAE